MSILSVLHTITEYSINKNPPVLSLFILPLQGSWHASPNNHHFDFIQHPERTSQEHEPRNEAPKKVRRLFVRLQRRRVSSDHQINQFQPAGLQSNTGLPLRRRKATYTVLGVIPTEQII